MSSGEEAEAGHCLPQHPRRQDPSSERSEGERLWRHREGQALLGGGETAPRLQFEPDRDFSVRLGRGLGPVSAAGGRSGAHGSGAHGSGAHDRSVRIVFFAVPADPDLVLGEVPGVGSFVLVEVEGIEVEAVDLVVRIDRVGAAGPLEQRQSQRLPLRGDEELLLHALAERGNGRCRAHHGQMEVGRTTGLSDRPHGRDRDWRRLHGLVASEGTAAPAPPSGGAPAPAGVVAAVTDRVMPASLGA